LSYDFQRPESDRGQGGGIGEKSGRTEN